MFTSSDGGSERLALPTPGSIITLRLGGLGPQPMLHVLHSDVLSILSGVPEIQRDVIDRRSADVTAETTAA